MKLTFRFPVLHDGCDNCASRFQCMTMKIHKEEGYYQSMIVSEFIPFRIGLKCIDIQPYLRVNSFSLTAENGGMRVFVSFMLP